MTEVAVIGIDLGTTFSAMAYVNRHGMPEIIPNAEGKRTTPSVVHFSDDGSVVVGQVARNQALVAPDRTIQFIKREMGDSSYRKVIDGVEHVPEDLSALILKKLKDDAEAHFGEPVAQAVISVPAYFKDAQRRATQLAGEIAGLDVFAILNEPTAAALSYGLTRVEGDSKNLLIYDFGGGTFDVTVLRIEGPEFTVLATDGDSHLGGADIDQRLADFLADEYLAHRGVDLREDPGTKQDLLERAEIAKIDLSARQRVMLSLGAGTDAMRIDLDRDVLFGLIADLLEQTKSCVADALQSSGLGWSEIDHVLPVGGSSRLVAVRELLREMSGQEVTTDINPDECVALGTAIRAGLADITEISRPPGDGSPRPLGSDIVVRDVAPHSLGVRALTPQGQPINSIIIPRLTPVPCERRRTYATRVADQEQISVEVLQGEAEDPFSVEVESIGRVEMDGLPARPAGDVIVEVLLRYNLDGVVEVEAKELIDGRVVRQQLLERTGELDAEIVGTLTQRVADSASPAEEFSDEEDGGKPTSPELDPEVSDSDLSGADGDGDGDGESDEFATGDRILEDHPPDSESGLSAREEPLADPSIASSQSDSVVSENGDDDPVDGEIGVESEPGESEDEYFEDLPDIVQIGFAEPEDLIAGTDTSISGGHDEPESLDDSSNERHS